jgi:hypothetical protein
MNILIETITATDPAKRNRSFYEIAKALSAKELLQSLRELDAFRKATPSLYDKVRAILFLYAGFRFFLMESKETPTVGKIPYAGFEDLLGRRFEHAITTFLGELDKHGPNAMLFSALADSYHQLSFQTLANQVRKSVRSSKGNQWMFRVGHQEEHPIQGAAGASGGLALLPGAARAHGRAYGLDAQRMVRYFLPGHGLPRGRAGS